MFEKLNFFDFSSIIPQVKNKSWINKRKDFLIFFSLDVLFHIVQCFKMAHSRWDV